MLLNKNFVMQGGVRNYLGKTEEVKNAPKYWKSSPTNPKTELSYITDAEKELLLKANLHGSLINQQPNIGASGILSFDGWGDASDGFGSSSSGNTGYSDFASPSSTTASQDFSTQAVSGGQTDYDGGGGNDYSGPTYDEAALSQPSTITGPTDPGVAGTYVDGKFVPSQDTIKGIPGYIQNIQAEYASNPLSFLLSPLGTAAKVAGQTLAANYMLGNFPSFSISGGASSMQDAGIYFSDGGDQLQSYLTPIAPYAITGATPQESQVMKYFNNMGTTQSPLSSSLETSYNQAKANINNLLGVGSLQGQFGYSTQPYGGLSASNLATNPFNIPYLQQRGLI
jgi:hypothetical protein